MDAYEGVGPGGVGQGEDIEMVGKRCGDVKAILVGG